MLRHSDYVHGPKDTWICCEVGRETPPWPKVPKIAILGTLLYTAAFRYRSVGPRNARRLLLFDLSHTSTRESTVYSLAFEWPSRCFMRNYVVSRNNVTLVFGPLWVLASAAAG